MQTMQRNGVGSVEGDSPATGELETEALSMSVCPPPPLTSLITPAEDSNEDVDNAGAVTTDPTEKDRIWTYLSSLRVHGLRHACKEYGVLQKGVKMELLVRLVRHLQQLGSDGMFLWENLQTSAGFDAHRFGESYRKYAFWREHNEHRSMWTRMPEDINGEEGVSGDTAGVQHVFSVNEFAKLVVLLSTNDQLRAALLASGAELSREQLDNRVSRDAFWSTVVAPLFNDAAQRPIFDFTGTLEIAESWRAPPVARTGDVLKRHYHEIRSQFTYAYEKWSRSGQNNPGNFADFCLRCRRNGELSSAGQKCMILFAVLQCGCENERTDVLDFTLQTFPVHSMGDSGESSPAPSLARGGRRKRKNDILDSIGDSMKEVASMFRERMCDASADERMQKLARLERLVLMKNNVGLTDSEVVDLIDQEIETTKSTLRN